MSFATQRPSRCCDLSHALPGEAADARDANDAKTACRGACCTARDARGQLAPVPFSPLVSLPLYTCAGVLPLWAYEGEEHGRVWWDYRVSRVVCRACALKASARGWLDACGSEFARVLSPSPDARMVLLTDERNLELLTSAVAAIPSGAVSGGTVADAGMGGRWGIAAVRSFQLSPTTTGLPPLMPCSSTHNTRTGPRLHYRLLTLCPAAY